MNKVVVGSFYHDLSINRICQITSLTNNNESASVLDIDGNFDSYPIHYFRDSHIKWLDKDSIDKLEQKPRRFLNKNSGQIIRRVYFEDFWIVLEFDPGQDVLYAIDPEGGIQKLEHVYEAKEDAIWNSGSYGGFGFINCSMNNE